jgi:hypothetical protein
MKHVQKIHDYINRTTSKSLVTINQFKLKGEQHGYYTAFEWGGDAVYASANIRVMSEYDKEMKHFSEDGNKFCIVDFKERLVSRIVIMGRYSQSSSSPLSDMLKQAELKAVADLLEFVSDLIKYGAPISE